MTPNKEIHLIELEEFNNKLEELIKEQEAKIAKEIGGTFHAEEVEALQEVVAETLVEEPVKTASEVVKSSTILAEQKISLPEFIESFENTNHHIIRNGLEYSVPLPKKPRPVTVEIVTDKITVNRYEFDSATPVAQLLNIHPTTAREWLKKQKVTEFNNYEIKIFYVGR
jgi:hypothetical protein